MVDRISKSFDVLVVGAGPAGLAAAATAGECGARVGLIDDNPNLGGQIWRREPLSNWLTRLQAARVEILCGAQAIQCDPATSTLLAERTGELLQLSFSKLVLATGARERFLPFPGWTLPNVMGAGGLQAMVKSGLPIADKRVVVAGSGPLLLPVAAYLRKRGAHILAVCEQTSWTSLASFAARLFADPGKLRQAIQFQLQLRGVPFWPNSWPVEAKGREVLASVTINRGGHKKDIACDYLACGFHLTPNIELASLLGCEIRNGFVLTNEAQQTSLANVFCAGEATAIAGLEQSLREGNIAGLSAAGRTLPAPHQPSNFAVALNRTFALSPELRALPQPETIVCRCEDVTHGRARQYTSWRDAKNQTRMGMGPCQGRVCGPIAQFLYGWKPESIRPPVFPVTVGTLAAIGRDKVGGYE